MQYAQKTIYFAQSIVLSLTAVLLFLLFCKCLSKNLAFWLALSFACNPYMLILVGLLHYSLLHIFLIVLSLVSLVSVVEVKEVSEYRMILPGICWGLTSLLRPVTLILPPFILVILLVKFRGVLKQAIKPFVFFCLGMFLAIGPYTYRNYLLTGRFIPVNAQGCVAFWAATVPQRMSDANHYKWMELWNSYGMPIFSRVTRTKEYQGHVYIDNLIPLEDEFKKQALNNLYHQPATFVGNVVKNAVSFNLNINSVLIKLFQSIQHSDGQIKKAWCSAGYVQDFYNSKASHAFEIFVDMLMILSLGGVLKAFQDRDFFLLTPGMVYLCVCLAHSITYMDMMYYYLKFPFLFIFTGYFIGTLESGKKRHHQTKEETARFLTGGIVIFSLGLSLIVMNS